MFIIASTFLSSISDNTTKSQPVKSEDPKHSENPLKSEDPKHSGKSGTDLKLLTWNLMSYCGTDGPDGGATQEALINDHGPWDITGFQETGTANKLNLTGLKLVDDTYENNNTIWVTKDGTITSSGSKDVTWDEWGHDLYSGSLSISRIKGK